MPTYVVAANNADGNSDDTDEYINPADGPFGTAYLGDFSSALKDFAIRIDTTASTPLPQGATVTAASVSIPSGGDVAGTCDGAWFGFDVDTATVFNAADVHRISDHHTRTTATVTDNIATTPIPHVSPSLVTIVQELVDRPGFSGILGLCWRSSSDTAGSEWYQTGAVETGNPASVTIEWDAADTTPESSDTGTLAEGRALALPSTDAATLADAVSGVAVPSSDSGTGTEAVSGIALATADAGTLAETVAIAVSTTDTGTVSETEDVDTGESTTPSSDDTGTLAEAASITATIALVETGTLADAVGGIALASSDEFGQEELVEGTEPITAVEGQTIALSAQIETGTLAEAMALALPSTETGTAAEQATMAVAFSVTDSGTFTEATIVQQGESNPVDAEAGTFGEFASVAVAVLDGDAGTASEGPAVSATLISAETAALIESGALLNFTGIAGGILSVSARAHGSLGIEA